MSASFHRGGWEVRWRDAAGRRRARRFPSEDAARAFDEALTEVSSLTWTRAIRSRGDRARSCARVRAVVLAYPRIRCRRRIGRTRRSATVCCERSAATRSGSLAFLAVGVAASFAIQGRGESLKPARESSSLQRCLELH
jgi:hypothetical protein